jgi:hypothetical protein
MGVSFRSKIAVDTQGGKWLGWRYNFDGTPHTKKLICQDRPGEATEQRKDCQNPAGPDFYMTLPGHFEDDPCDRFSQQPYWCHHKPEGPKGASGKGAQVGPTTVTAVPSGDSPHSSRGRSVTVNVQP